MKTVGNLVIAIAAASLIALPDSAWAGHGSGRGGGGHVGSGHSGRSSGQGHRHHYGYRAVFVGGALLYPWPYSYGLDPLWADRQPPGPIVYVEEFTGTPTPEMKDWIYCPAKAASYPEITECPGGWQRVIPQAQTTGQIPAP